MSPPNASLLDEQEPFVLSHPDERPLGQVVSYGCRDCDLPDATGAWPDAWVGVEEAAAHREKTGHRVYLAMEALA